MSLKMSSLSRKVSLVALCHLRHRVVVLQSHYSSSKAAAALGIGMNSVIKVDSDERGRMDPAALDSCIRESQRVVRVCVTCPAASRSEWNVFVHHVVSRESQRIVRLSVNHIKK